MAACSLGMLGCPLEVDGALEESEHQQAQGFIKNKVRGLPGGAMAKIPHSQCRGAQAGSLVRGLNPHAVTENVFASTKDSACHN